MTSGKGRIGLNCELAICVIPSSPHYIFVLGQILPCSLFFVTSSVILLNSVVINNSLFYIQRVSIQTSLKWILQLVLLDYFKLESEHSDCCIVLGLSCFVLFFHQKYLFQWSRPSYNTNNINWLKGQENEGPCNRNTPLILITVDFLSVSSLS